MTAFKFTLATLLSVRLHRAGGLNPGLSPLPQAGQFGSQGGAWPAELPNLLLLGQDELSGLGWPLQPTRFWNPGRTHSHHGRSLPEMQPGIKLLQRFSGAEVHHEPSRPLDRRGARC
jgi:hypothetical protein